MKLSTTLDTLICVGTAHNNNPPNFFKKKT